MMHVLYKLVEYVKNSKNSQQTIYLYSSHIVVLIAGMLISSLNTRFLGPMDFGIYATIIAVSEFVLLFIDFGFFSSGARVLALKEDPSNSKQIVGVLILLTSTLALLSALILFLLSFVIDNILDANIGSILKVFSIFIGLSLFHMVIESICRGSNHIGRFSIFNILNRLLYIILISAFILFGYYNIKLAILFNFLSLFLASLFIFRLFSPSYSNLSANFNVILQDLKIYGFKAYIGNLASTASYRTDSLLLSYFSGTTTVGYYRLGTLLTFPMMNFSRSLATTFFKEFAISKKIKQKVLLLNGLWLACGSLALILLGKHVIYFLFGDKYASVNPLILPLALTAFFGGLAIPYNMYLGAKGKGSFLQKTALIVSGFNITLNIIMIPRYHALGACYASLLALIINLMLHIHYYNKTLEDNLVLSI